MRQFHKRMRLFLGGHYLYTTCQLFLMELAVFHRLAVNLRLSLLKAQTEVPSRERKHSELRFVIVGQLFVIESLLSTILSC